METRLLLATAFVVAGLGGLLTVGCADSSTPTSPTSVSPVNGGSSVNSASGASTSAVSVAGAVNSLAGAKSIKSAKVDICHVTGNGSYRLINVSSRAQAAHLAHGDGLPFSAAPGGGFVFDGACNVRALTLTVEKTSTTTVVSGPGPVPYSYLVTNLGTVAITGLTLSDDHVDAVPTCLLTTIPVNGWTTCTATYTVTQADLDANGSPQAGSGELFNTVTASSNEAPDAIDDLRIPME